MRNRINLLAFGVTLAASAAGDLGHPLAARATAAPSTIEWMYCCDGGRTRCCGANWCAITPRGCATG